MQESPPLGLDSGYNLPQDAFSAKGFTFSEERVSRRGLLSLARRAKLYLTALAAFRVGPNYAVPPSYSPPLQAVRTLVRLEQGELSSSTVIIPKAKSLEAAPYLSSEFPSADVLMISIEVR